MTDCPQSRQGLPERAGLALLSVYKYAVSPVLYAFGVRCRHEPTCSAYAGDAIRAQGLWRGSWLAAGRVLRCRPGGTCGHDPAPREKRAVSWWKIWAFRERPVRL